MSKLMGSYLYQIIIDRLEIYKCYRISVTEQQGQLPKAIDNKIWSNYYKVQSMKDQFINVPLLVRKQTLSFDQKNQTIKALELKNLKLRTQLLKIQRAIDQNQEEGLQRESPKKRLSVFEWEQSEQVLTKQLMNSYKKIKMFEYQINKLQKDQQSKAAMKQKIKQIEAVVKEKKFMNERLKQQLMQQKRASQQTIKRLQNNNQHEQNQIYLKRLDEEIMFYREKTAIVERKESIKIQNMRKQYKALKQLQNHLLQIGLAVGQLQQIKRRVLKFSNKNKKSLSQNLIRKQDSNFVSLEDNNQSQDRSQEYFQTILAEITLLKKIQKDHEKQIIQAQLEKEEALHKSVDILSKLSQCQKQIQQAEKEIQSAKARVIPANLKPIIASIKRSVSNYQGENINKINYSKQEAQNKDGKRIQHLLKFESFGLQSAKCQKFSDRNLLGKQNLYAKITGIKVFIQRGSGVLGGIQVAYDGKKGGQYVRKDKQSKVKQYIQQQYICKSNQFIKTLTGTLNIYSQIQSILVTSSDGTKYKLGTSKNNQKQFHFAINTEQYPTCLFGSLKIVKETGKREISYIQHLGFQIQNMKFSSQQSTNLPHDQISL